MRSLNQYHPNQSPHTASLFCCVAACITQPASHITLSPMFFNLLPVVVVAAAHRQWLFLLEGIPSVMLGVALVFFLPESPTASKWLNEEQKELWSKDVSVCLYCKGLISHRE